MKVQLDYGCEVIAAGDRSQLTVLSSRRTNLPMYFSLRETHMQQVSDEGTCLREPVFFPFFLQTCTGGKKNKPRTTIIYATEREDKIIDSGSCVNVCEWHACVNMGDRLLSMFV